MKKVFRVVKVLIAASALTFGALLLLFLIVLVAAGPEKAELAWGSPFYIGGRLISPPICLRYLSESAGKVEKLEGNRQ